MSDTPAWSGPERRRTDRRRPPGPNGLHVSGPAGFSLAATGREVIIVLGLLAIGALLLDHAKGATAQHTEISAAFDRVACVLSLDMPARLEALQSGDPCRYALTMRPGGRWREDAR